MANSDDPLSRESSEIILRGPPGRRFKLTVECPIFLCMLAMSMSSKYIFQLYIFIMLQNYNKFRLSHILLFILPSINEIKRFLFSLGSAINNIVFYRTCVYSLNHTIDECKDFLSPIRSNSTKMLENDVQKYATFVFTVKSVMESFAPAVLSLFLGVWSDTYGRKPLIVWPIFGMF